MKILKALPTRCALIKGADLWVLSDPKHSTWNKYIDWHLQFQLRKSRSSPLKSPDTKHIAQYLPPHYNISLKTFTWSAPQPLPLLIKSSDWLSNRWILELGHHSQWMDKIHQIWLLLEKPCLRIFIPQFLTVEQLKKQWNSLANMYSLQYVKELTTNEFKY